MEYPLLGPALGGGFRKRLGRLSIDEARFLLKRGRIEAVRDEKTGRVLCFTPAKRVAQIGQRIRIVAEAEQTVESTRHLTGVSYAPSHNIISEIRYLSRAGAKRCRAR